MAVDWSQSCMFVPLGLTPSECASWVQAWGTIAAIIGAFLVARYQFNSTRRHEEAARRLDDLTRLEAVRAIATQIEGYCEVLSSVWDEIPPGEERKIFDNYRFLEFENFQKLVQGFVHAGIPAELMTPFAILASHLAGSNGLLLMIHEQTRNGMPLEPDHYAAFRGRVDNAQNAAAVLVRRCDDCEAHWAPGRV
ncbi:hypothetical protein dqs_1924 [Azoarcus olearius]|uniref:hypothetical protein n=1 Tax=Azoarcus sp. (strain BH72) TaxID=418699 RepID=UPI000806114A|nr:hypothetical protein [Azoarcus olearius]ANQ84962.1 hypothetical protein dqs_1924 [Azoarcus olearius]